MCECFCSQLFMLMLHIHYNVELSSNTLCTVAITTCSVDIRSTRNASVYRHNCGCLNAKFTDWNNESKATECGKHTHTNTHQPTSLAPYIIQNWDVKNPDVYGSTYTHPLAHLNSMQTRIRVWVRIKFTDFSVMTLLFIRKSNDANLWHTV